MNYRDLRPLMGALLAVAVPALVLTLSVGRDRHEAGLTAAPFAWGRLLIVHLVAALPLGFLAAGAWVRARGTPRRLLWAALGSGAAWAAAVLSPDLGAALARGGYGIFATLLLRSALAWVLVVPWCVAFAGAPSPQGGRNSSWLALVGLALAVVPPGAYALAVIEARTSTAAELLARERFMQASRILAGLGELGSDRPLVGGSHAIDRKQVAARVAQLRRAAERSMPAGAPPQAHIDRAVLLLQLDRRDEAAAELRTLAPGDPQAALLLATVRRDQERWAESDALYTAALDRLLPLASGDAGARAGCKAALEGLAFNARSDGRPGDAERALRRGLDLLPGEAAYFHFQLGRHYQDGGRPGPALEHLHRAAQLDPARFRAAAEKHIGAIRTQTYGCFLPR